MGFFEDIFGGQNQQSTSSASSTPINFTNPTLSGLAGPLSGSLQGLLQSWGLGGPQFNGQLTAGPTNNENSLLNTSSLTNPGGNAQNYIKQVLGGNFMPGNPNGNPFLSSAITAAQRPTFEALDETLGRNLPGAFTQAGQSIQSNGPGNSNGGSSAFDRAAAIASRSALNTAGDIASRMGSDAYNTGVSQMNTAAGLDQNAVNTTVQALQAQALPRMIQQYGLDQGVNLFQTGVKNLLSLLSLVGQAQSPVLGNKSSSTSQSSGTSEKGIFPDLFPKGL